MSYQVNLHAPPGIEDFRNLSPENFVSITKHEGNFTTTDVYYQPKFAKTEGRKERFMSKLSGFVERLKHFKSANASGSLFVALTNIKSKDMPKNASIGGSQANLLPSMMHDLALIPRNEISENGTTFTLANWGDEDNKNYESKFATTKQKEQIQKVKELDQDLEAIADVLDNLKNT